MDVDTMIQRCCSLRYVMGFLLLGGCLSAVPPHKTVAPSSTTLGNWATSTGWGEVRSRLFRMRIPLPEPASWQVQESLRPPLFLATHAPTRSTLSLTIAPFETLMNRQLCEQSARNTGWIPTGSLRTLGDSLASIPAGYDTRVWIALQSTPSSTQGHVFAFGAQARRCIFVHYTTEQSNEAEDAVVERLSLVQLRLLNGLQQELLGTVPRLQER